MKIPSTVTCTVVSSGLDSLEMLTTIQSEVLSRERQLPPIRPNPTLRKNNAMNELNITASLGPRDHEECTMYNLNVLSQSKLIEFIEQWAFYIFI